MHDITAHAPKAGRWVREWWLWPLALLTLGWALLLGAYAWNHDDEQRKRSAPGATRDLDRDESTPLGRASGTQPFSMRGRVLVEHGLVLRSAVSDGGRTVATTQWLFPIVDADWRDGQTVKHVLRVPDGAALRALSHAPRGPWLVTQRGVATGALIEALRAKGLQLDASATLVQWHSSPIEP